MKQRWWEDHFSEWRTLSRDQMQHVRDAFDFIGSIVTAYSFAIHPDDRNRGIEIFARNDKPEPEWQIVPDSPGMWHRRSRKTKTVYTPANVFETPGGVLCMEWEDEVVLSSNPPRRRIEVRAIEDIGPKGFLMEYRKVKP